MTLYFFCSSSSMLEYLTMNKIVCNKYLEIKARKIVESLGLLSGSFLFLTQKKLRHEDRIYGFGQDSSEFPIAVEITIPEKDLDSIPVIALSSDGTFAEQFGTLKDKTDSLGFFIAGEIPYSYISAILFEDSSKEDDLYKPSKDLYFPEHMYGIMDQSFVETIDTGIVATAGKAIDKKYVELQVSDIVSARNKISSIILNTVLETKEWPYGERHIANFDDLTLELTGLRDIADAETAGLYSAFCKSELKDAVLNDWLKGNKDSGEIGLFFKELIEQLIKKNSTVFSQKEFDEVLNLIWASGAFDAEARKQIEAEIVRIEGVVYGNSGIGLDNLMISFKDGLKVLQGLVFFLRNPLSSVNLADSLKVYKVNSEARRYAWVMFAALNGVERVLADKTGNEYVMSVAESYALSKCQNQYMINKSASDKKYERTLKLVMEEVVSSDEIREFILSDEYAGRLQSFAKSFLANKSISKGIKEKEYQKIANPFTGVVPADEYLTFEAADAVLKQISFAMKKARQVYDTKAILDNFVRNRNKFTELFNKDTEFWKTIYKDGKNR